MSVSEKVAELSEYLTPDDTSAWIVNKWTDFEHQRQKAKDAWQEVQEYLFATDTTDTTNSSLPWKNSTTLPKLTQIRDNLHSNYRSSLFPNDRWMKWEGHSLEDASKQKAKAITAYMDNKLREGGFFEEIDKCLLDYIDYGNAFATIAFEDRYKETETEKVRSFTGPVVVRIDPNDIVFNPLATDFSKTYKIIRSIKTVGELKKLAMSYPDHAFWTEALERREKIKHHMNGVNWEDSELDNLYTVDGFCNLQQYYQSDYIEVLEFFGDYHDMVTGELKVNQMITVVDRNFIARQVDSPTYDGQIPIYHTGWRKRPRNLWAMGPLENLVGMQYRIDHLENLKADAMDLAVHPPLAIAGDVEPFTWAPGAVVQIDGDGGSVTEISKNLQGVISATNEIERLEAKMELYAGAPREAAGVRTPGEKTAFEVQSLENAAGRIFQMKITNFEIEFIEKILNGMLEVAHRNFADLENISLIDSDLGVRSFQQITKEDITAKGVLRPIGARYFSQKAQELQNLVGVFNTPLGQMIMPHTSAKALTQYIEDVMDIRAYSIFRPNVAIEEQMETQSLMNQAQEDLDVQAQVSQDFPEELVGT